MCIICEMRKEQKERVDVIKVNQHLTESQTLITEANALVTLVSVMNDLKIMGQKERAEAVGKMIDGLLPKAGEPKPTIPDGKLWAEALIRQLPESHDGRNSWLLSHGTKVEKAPDAPTKQEEIANLAKSLAEQLGCTVEVFTFPQK